MQRKIPKTLLFLLISIILSVSICFSIKFLAMKDVVPWNIGYNDLGGWALSKRGPFSPGIPYLDKVVEYPVIIGMVMYALSRFSLDVYLWLHYLLFLTCSITATIYLWKLSEHFKTQKKNLFIFWALAPSALYFSYFNWDIITVMFSVIALYFFVNKRDTAGALFLALGVATKMYPVIFLLPVLMKRKTSDIISIITIFSLVILAINLPFMVLGFDNWLATYSFHSQREPNPDSIWATAIALFPQITIPIINYASLILFAGIYFFTNIKFRSKNLPELFMLSILCFLLVNKVFSPQFLLWILPFLALIGTNPIFFYSAELANIAVLHLTLSHIFSGATHSLQLTWSWIFVWIRHIAISLIFWKTFKKKPQES